MVTMVTNPNAGAEGRMNGLEHQLGRTESQRKELQVRLANLVSVLQATLGNNRCVIAMQATLGYNDCVIAIGS